MESPEDSVSHLARCSCGNLSVAANKAPRKVSACHCKSCQRRTGSAFGVAVFFGLHEVLIAGESRSFVRAGDSGMNLTFHFCPQCGSTVYWLPEFRPGLIAIALGCFDDTDSFELEQSVYDQFAQPWVTLQTGSGERS